MGFVSKFCTFILIAGSVIFLIGGWLAQQQVLKRIRCEMTYSSPKVVPEKFHDERADGYSLWKYEDGLNKQPVLFIPGHIGSTTHARGLAASIHNKDNVFHYFTVGFGRQASAYHASTILNQAIYVNEAIRHIQSLYKANNTYQSIPRIIIAGHSTGGMVARTALTLENHPEDCPINAIVMLATPNKSPAYSPDASMDELYYAVNRAWKQSFFPESIGKNRIK